MKKFAEQVAASLKAEIPGLTTYVDYHLYRGEAQLHARYLCPCGEISGFSMALFEYELEEARYVPVYVEHIKHLLREHVRGEGNKPNF